MNVITTFESEREARERWITYRPAIKHGEPRKKPISVDAGILFEIPVSV